MFYDAAQFPFTQLLENNWDDIYQEYRKLDPNHLLASPWKDLHDNQWSLFPLMGLKHKYKNSCMKFPKTTTFIEQIPGITSASFSVLAPHTHIKSHEGYSDAVLRCHLALIIPDDCKIRVGDETRHWQQGKCLIFDDTVNHEAWNKSDNPRVILLIDFKK